MNNELGKMVYKSHNIKDAITTFEGILVVSKMGQLECKVCFDATTNTYSGARLNKCFSPAEWSSKSISTQEAQDYYQAFLSAKTIADAIQQV